MPLRHRQPGGGEDLLRALLVHRQRRGEHAGMGVGDPEPLEDALDAAVLAPAAVQRVEGDVGPRLAERRREVGAGVDLDDLESLLPQRSRALATRHERNLTLGRTAAHQHCDAGCCPARHARLNPVPAGLLPALSGLSSLFSFFRGPYGRPTRMISHSNDIPVDSKTFFRTNSPKFSRSAAFAAPVLIRKLRVLRRHLRSTQGCALHAGVLDQLPGLEVVHVVGAAGRGEPRRIAEGRPRRALLDRLARIPPRQLLLHPRAPAPPDRRAARSASPR